MGASAKTLAADGKGGGYSHHGGHGEHGGRRTSGLHQRPSGGTTSDGWGHDGSALRRVTLRCAFRLREQTSRHVPTVGPKRGATFDTGERCRSPSGGIGTPERPGAAEDAALALPKHEGRKPHKSREDHRGARSHRDADARARERAPQTTHRMRRGPIAMSQHIPVGPERRDGQAVEDDASERQRLPSYGVPSTPEDYYRNAGGAGDCQGAQDGGKGDGGPLGPGKGPGGEAAQPLAPSLALPVVRCALAEPCHFPRPCSEVYHIEGLAASFEARQGVWGRASRCFRRMAMNSGGRPWPNRSTRRREAEGATPPARRGGGVPSGTQAPRRGSRRPWARGARRTRRTRIP